MKEVREQQQQQGLYRSEFEHDNCGIGAVVNIKGKKTHDTVANALKIVEHLEHRAGKDAEGKTGDGVGILLQISHKFFKKACKKEGFEIGDEREYGIAQFFFPQHEIKRAQAKKMFEIILEKEGASHLRAARHGGLSQAGGASAHLGKTLRPRRRQSDLSGARHAYR